MPIAKSTMADSFQASVGKTALGVEQGGFGGVFTLTCYDKDGNLKWEDSFHNLVVNVGLQYLNEAFFDSLGGTYTAAWYLGLVDGSGATTFSASDTLASHGASGSGGWSELLGGGAVYSGTRKLVNFGAASAANPSQINNSASPSVFAITATADVAGAFLTNVASGTSGILFSANDFTGGTKNVANGDTVNVTYTFSATAT
jgi:hypothetical protein